jgi:hypothetical protein
VDNIKTVRFDGSRRISQRSRFIVSRPQSRDVTPLRRQHDRFARHEMPPLEEAICGEIILSDPGIFLSHFDRDISQSRFALVRL